ncbi:hypothetical protein [Ureaplasma diversum]|uniref:Uncharacterized protein n=2 Tax=Ureaplasma diversum TaxID=42094 RepID=A0A084EW90_9BACT|nr:hypothetical protein [Ureaplasma diversum]KEZ22232.1 Hypothetical protein, predicted transmembrane protein [Ureaplasma diversum NCTC 246]
MKSKINNQVTKKHKPKQNVYVLDKHLRTKKGLVWSWSTIFVVLLLLSIGFGLCLHFLNPIHLNLQEQFIIAQNDDLVKPIKIMVYTGFALLFVPLLFLLGCWITGINGLHASVLFHAFVWFFYSLAFLLFIICLCLNISVHIYY